ncbi:MAG TPA: uracil-DNA glycosylase [Nevskiaceae bacterium]|nr:uracil-DNA glycosylase [Nevskiaceae bacterium]
MTDKKRQLEELKKELESKAGRLPLIKKPTDVIFGEGKYNAKIMFIGEAGGYWEAKLRRPFVGNAGKLLDQLIKSVGLKRNEVYISNVVKARPPENRDPLAEEIEAFRPYLDKEIEIVDPKIIVTLGRFSMNKFLPGEYISQVHGQGRFVDFNGKRFIVIPMYHPAAGLRNGRIMTELKKDFQKISKFLEDELEPVEETVKEKKQESQQEQLKIL